MRARAFITRLSFSMGRWGLIGVSNRKMARLWKAFLSEPTKWWTKRELCEATKLPDGSFEAELVELDMAGLVSSEQRFAGPYARRLTDEGLEVMKSGDPQKFQWEHPRFGPTSAKVAPGQIRFLKVVSVRLLNTTIVFTLLAIFTGVLAFDVPAGMASLLAAGTYAWRIRIAKRLAGQELEEAIGYPMNFLLASLLVGVFLTLTGVGVFG